ncbi:MAG: hypothetical protein KBE65_21955 [Phycisphaerae bacterium]|nr:hypothetical protein [Phycisphaerae bacterium]
MRKMTTVAVCGSNLVMSSLCASLQNRPGFEVRGFNGLSDADLDEPDATLPDVILFDLAAGQPDFAIRLLRRSPTTLLIGVDLLSHKMLVLSGEQSRLLTIDDLMHVMGQARAEVK